jgi:hypothetical protein
MFLSPDMFIHTHSLYWGSLLLTFVLLCVCVVVIFWMFDDFHDRTVRHSHHSQFNGRNEQTQLGVVYSRTDSQTLCKFNLELIHTLLSFNQYVSDLIIYDWLMCWGYQWMGTLCRFRWCWCGCWVSIRSFIYGSIFSLNYWDLVIGCFIKTGGMFL